MARETDGSVKRLLGKHGHLSSDAQLWGRDGRIPGASWAVESVSSRFREHISFRWRERKAADDRLPPPPHIPT